MKKSSVFTLVEPNDRIKSLKVDSVTFGNLKQVIREDADPKVIIYTDEFKGNKGLDKDFQNHEIVNQNREEYVRGIAPTNTTENFFSILKRGITGIYQHIFKQHLPFYSNEVDFRYNYRKIPDIGRTREVLKGFERKRLHYQNSYLN